MHFQVDIYTVFDVESDSAVRKIKFLQGNEQTWISTSETVIWLIRSSGYILVVFFSPRLAEPVLGRTFYIDVEAALTDIEFFHQRGQSLVYSFAILLGAP